MFKMDACEATGQEFVWVYRLRAEGPFELHPEEIETGRWFEPAEITACMAREPEIFAGAFRHLWKRWQA